jgi:hypothetical protein
MASGHKAGRHFLVWRRDQARSQLKATVVVPSRLLEKFMARGRALY